MQVELSIFDELELTEHISVNESCNKKDDGQLDVTAAKFADVTLDQQTHVQSGVLGADSAVSMASSLTGSSCVSDESSSVLPSQGSSSVCPSSAGHPDSQSQCSAAAVGCDQLTNPHKSASSRRRKRNKSSKKQDATPLSCSAADRRMSFITFM